MRAELLDNRMHARDSTRRINVGTKVCTKKVVRVFTHLVSILSAPCDDCLRVVVAETLAHVLCVFGALRVNDGRDVFCATTGADYASDTLRFDWILCDAVNPKAAHW